MSIGRTVAGRTRRADLRFRTNILNVWLYGRNIFQICGLRLPSEGRKFYLHWRCQDSPHEPHARRNPHAPAWRRWRGCRRFLRSTTSAPSLPAAARPRRGRPNCCRLPAPGSTFSRRRQARTCSRSPPLRRAAPSSSMSDPGRTSDFAGAAIAVADCADDDEAAQFAAAARAAGVPVNVIDRPAFCDFSFGAIVNRSPLVIGISTDGAAPVFGQAIRAKIEALIPKGFARWAEAARTLAAARAGARSAVPRPPQRSGRRFTDARGRRAERRADRCRSRRAARSRPATPQSRLGRARRRRPGRSGIADAARRARAAIGRRDPVRRSGVAPTSSISRAARRRKCWSAKPATRRPASRTTSTR